jgi:hypothetical protein
MVLLVVMAMLALFASVALSFVFFADAEAEAARLARESQSKDQPDIDPEMLAEYFLKQLIYPTDNIYSAMRGWDLATSMYGNNPGALNHMAFSGVGRAALKGANDPVLGVDYFNLINYQKFYDPDPTKAGDPTVNFERLPEFYGRPSKITNATNPKAPNPIVVTSANHNLNDGDRIIISGVEGNTAANGVFTIKKGDANNFSLVGSTGNAAYTGGGGWYNVRSYRGGNPPWTAYDTNSLFLAKMNANGTIEMPSFERPWLAAAMPPPGDPARKYTTLFPDGSWHPGFANPLPDQDPSTGRQVKNLEFGPGGNDSKWMDLGFPVMTAPNGQRYKALFAPLIVDLNNRLHLWAHGNRIGAGGTPVSNMGFGPTEVNLSKLWMKDPDPKSAALKALELQTLFNLKYGGLKDQSVQGALLPQWPITAIKPGPWYGKLDFDALNPASGKSTAHLATGFKTASTSAVLAGVQAMGVPPTGPAVPGGFPWSFVDVVNAGTQLLVDSGANSETVTVISVDPVNNTFTANFAKAHPIGAPIVFNTYFGYPSYPAGWNNTVGESDSTEVTAKGVALGRKPLGFNIITATSFNLPVVFASNSLLMSNQEALMRFGGTNSPALTSEIFRRMPLTFSDIRARNMVTMWSMHLARATGMPYLPFNRLTAGHYTYKAGAPYPMAAPVIPPAPDSTQPLPNSDYDLSGWRSTLSQVARVNLNRSLTSYPARIPITSASNESPIIITTPFPPTNGLSQFAGQQVIITGVRGNTAANGVWWAKALTSDKFGFNTVFGTAPNQFQKFALFSDQLLKTPVQGNGAYTGGGFEMLLAPYNQAVLDRQTFARDIYNALVRAAGARDPNVVAIANTTPAYKASRWLAQLAVNMVDYIDEDDNITAFPWLKDAAGNPVEWVYGTEQPRLVINEAYAQYDNDGADPSIYVTPQDKPQTLPKASHFKLNSWLELHNPLQGTPADSGTTFPDDGGNALLKTALYPVYQVAVCKSSAALTTAMRDPANNTGNPDFNVATGATRLLGPPNTDWGTTAITHRVLPANGAFSGDIKTAFVDTVANKGATEKNHIVTINFATPVPALPAVFTVGSRVTVTGVADPRYNDTYNMRTLQTDGKGNITGFTYRHGMTNLPDSGGGVIAIGGNTGFYVLGPNMGPPNPNLPMYLPGSDPGLVTTFASPQMSIQQPTGSGAIPALTYVLRRLTVPHLPPQPNPALPLYNPYITIDYLDGIPVNDGRIYNAKGLKTPAPPPVTAFKSYGRNHPYAAHSTQVAAQTTARPIQPFNTFFTHNSNAVTPFTWLTHLDRPLVNQLELLHMSGYKPHELTQQFVTAAGPFKHYAPWNDPSTLLYRALELMDTPNHMAGTARVWPGNINLNTITEEEIFQALCDSQDAQRAPLFTQADVKAIYNKLLIQRSLGGPEGTPFQSFGTGDINRTWLQPNLFTVGDPNAHPYAKLALLQKIFNNITTTSNVFGVWWTTGFFEVVDETVRPARLGKEIGRDEGRHIRHRFFAVVDRSGLQLGTMFTGGISLVAPQWDPTVKYTSGAVVTYKGRAYRNTVFFPNTNIGNDPSVPNSKFWGGASIGFVSFGTGSNKANFVPIAIEPGMVLELGTQLVSVLDINTFNNSFTSTTSIPAGTYVIRGNPGPPPNPYNLRRNTNIVLHMTVIE